MQNRKRSFWRIYLALGTVAIAVYPLIPAGAGRDWLATELIGISAVLMMALGVYMHRPRPASAWILLLAGQFAFVLGDFLFAYQEYVDHASPFPSVADVCYLSGYPLLWAGLTLLMRARSPRKDMTVVIDAAALTVSLALASWLFVMSPIAHDQTLTSTGRLISLAYPLGDVLLLTTALRLSMGWSRRPPAYWLLGAGVALLLIADSAYLLVLQAGSYTSGGIIDIGWLASYVLLGAAALHPSMKTLSLPASVRLPRLTPLRLSLLAAASVAAPAMLAVQYARGASLEIPIVASSSALLVLLVIARMAMLVRGHETRGAELEQHEAELTSELERRSLYDPVTGLGNRSYFLERLGETLSVSGRTPTSIVLLGVEDLRLVNECVGRATGEELLRAVAERLRKLLRQDDICARTGDNFAVLVEDDTVEPPVAVAQRLVKALRLSFHLSDEHETTTDVTAGVAIAAGERDAETLMRDAEIALSRARQLGSGSVQLFEPGMHTAVYERIVLKGQLERALAEGHFLLNYQPIVDLSSGGLWGVEALIRWRHPERGLVQPDAFIPLAEETGLIVPIGKWVLDEALRQAAIWNQMASFTSLAVTVNLSGRQLSSPELVDTVALAIEKTGIDPAGIVLEITETALMKDLDLALQTLLALKRLGIRLAIDDFGTGYSSLQYLRQIPADIIKIAKPFVDGVLTCESDAYRVANAIVHLGDAFGLQTLAEGIEEREQLDRMRDLGCELGQGFYFSRPLPAEEITPLLSFEPDALAA
ncbi:MAG: bifunctional diguanylate cyclase/phosphodiesterase [Gaiellaceae bacterium]